VLETAAGIGDGHGAGCCCCCGGGSGVQSGGAQVSRLHLRQPLPGGVDGPCGIAVLASPMPSAKEIGVRPMASLTNGGTGGTGGSRPVGMADCRKPHSGLDGGVVNNGAARKGTACGLDGVVRSGVAGKGMASCSSTLTDDDGGLAVVAASFASASSKLDAGGSAAAVAFAGASSRRNGGGGDLGSVLLRLKDLPSSGTK